MNEALVGRIHHSIPVNVLAQALPRMRPFDYGPEIRREFAQWVAGQRQPFECWQAAWNAWTGATPHHPGRVRLRVTCLECRGRLYSQRSMARGQYICMTCHGRRRQFIETEARWLPSPQKEDHA